MFFVGTLGLVTALISIVHNMLLFYTFNSSKVGFNLTQCNNKAANVTNSVADF